MASPDGASGGILRGHGVAFALVAIFAGTALGVAYAASDGAIFGQNSGSPASGVPLNDSSAGGAAVISRDSFDVAENAPAPDQPDTGNNAPPPEPSPTLSEEQRQLLAMRNFPWDSVAGRHIASNQDLMDRFRQPVPAEPGVEPLALSDRVLVNVERGDRAEEDDLELADIIENDVVDIEIPIDMEEDNDGEQPPEEDEQQEDDQDEEPQADEDQGDDSSGEGDQSGDDSSGEGSGEEDDSGSEEEEENDGDQPGSDGGSGGNSTGSDPPDNSGSGDNNNSTSTEDSSGDG